MLRRSLPGSSQVSTDVVQLNSQGPSSMSFRLVLTNLGTVCNADLCSVAAGWAAELHMYVMAGWLAGWLAGGREGGTDGCVCMHVRVSA